VLMRPLLLRPPVLLFFATRPATGRPLCRVLFSTLTTKRRPAAVGLAFLSAIILSLLRRRAIEEVDFLAVGQRHICFLPALALAWLAAKTLGLRLDIQCGHVFHAHTEQRRHCRPDFSLGGIGRNPEHDLIV